MRLMNGNVIMDDGLREGYDIIIEGNRIVGIEKNNSMMHTDAKDCTGLYLLPGFIDVHCHGGNGYDFMDGTVEAFEGIAKYHASHGTTRLYATSLSGSFEETRNFLDTFEKNAHKLEGSVLEGVHLEGPYFAVSQKGAQDEKYITPPIKANYEVLSNFGCVKRWSIAPELEGSMEMGNHLKEKGILCSVAHTDANSDSCALALKHGYNSMTHLYSGMKGVTRVQANRYAGAVEAGLLYDDYFVELIGDGVHLPVELVQLAIKVKPIDKVVGITDAMRGSGLKPGSNTKLGSLDHGQDVLITDEVALLPDRSGFAGSTATMDRVYRFLVNKVGISMSHASKIVSENPSKLMKIDNELGTLQIGKLADIVIMNEDLEVLDTIINGVSETK